MQLKRMKLERTFHLLPKDCVNDCEGSRRECGLIG